MKSITEFINEKQNFIVKGHTVNQTKYQIWESPSDGQYLRLNKLDDIYEICGDKYKQENIDKIYKDLCEEAERCPDFNLFLIKPIEHKREVDYLFGNEDDAIDAGFKQTTIKVSKNDFNVEFWKKNKWK